VNQVTGLAGTRADIMGGRDNGLTMLLYGSSGTGKTLTAESVAEITEMPLYRVMCGGIGTSENAIENDLTSVLDLAQTWNCVLLLEEADFFLQKGSLSDPARSSFVSSILRALDHYNGILILTSTRVDVFDEAITSRIRVMLHYEHLNQSSRKHIWHNLIDSFEEDKGRANFEEIRSHLDDLAGKELNGHQIRNVFKTAKELAMFAHERLEWGHLVQAVSISSTFTNI
jgi:SpoVK/Ycf46/Vps4 family AAA+-type ATPase